MVDGRSGRCGSNSSGLDFSLPGRPIADGAAAAGTAYPVGRSSATVRRLVGFLRRN